MIPVPEWVPPQITPIFRSLILSNDGATAIATRLATDERMRAVWDELLRKDRDTGEYFHLAKPRPTAIPLPKDDIQFLAIQEIVRFAISATCDKRAVSRPEDIERSRIQLNSQSNQLLILANDLELSIEHSQLGIVDDPSKELATVHLNALRHVAGWLDNLAAALRGPDDPMMVRRLRGDPLVKGVQITLASVCMELFGFRLDRTIATIASVAVGVDAKRRAARSALSRKSGGLK